MSDKTSNKLRENQRNTSPPPFCMHFTKDERKTLEPVAGNRPLAAYSQGGLSSSPPARTRGKKPVKDQIVYGEYTNRITTSCTKLRVLYHDALRVLINEFPQAYF